MGMDQIIEQLVFGQTQVKVGSALGIYLSPETIYISETKLGKDGKLSVEHLVRIPVPSDGKPAAGSTMTMSTDFLSDPAKVGGVIRQSMSQIRWGTKNAVVTLSHHLGLLRYFPMPMLERRFLKTAIPVEAKKYIPIPFDALAYDFQAAPMPPDAAGKARQGVLMAVTQKKNLANVMGLMEALGLTMLGLEVAPCSVLRLWQTADPPKGPEPFVQVHFDGNSVRVMICDRGLPVFFREVFLGGEVTLADQRKVDLPGCLSFASKQLALTGITKIKLSGTPAVLGPWKDALSAETGLPAEIQDTARLLSIKGGDWGGYAAIGASARAQRPAPADLDLSAVNRISDEERQTARDIVLAGAGVAGLVALLGAFAHLSYGWRARELTQYKVDPDVRAALLGLPQAQIDEKLAAMRDQFDRLQGTNPPGPKLSAVLRELIDLMPDSVWLTKISISNPLTVEKGKDALVLTFVGRARGATSAQEQEMAFSFRDALLASEIIGKAFEVQLSLQMQASSGAPDSSLDPRALAKKLEERTEFTVVMKSKRAP